MMLKNINRFALISGGGLIALMILGMVVSAILGASHEDINELNVVSEMMYYRIGFYIAVVLLWGPLCSWITRPNARKLKGLSEEELKEIGEKRQQDISYLRGMWWKVLLAFAAIEIVFIQQFGM